MLIAHLEPLGCEGSAVLRSWWRHEQQTVAVVLATVTHHSHSKVGTAYDAPRGQKKVTSTRVGPAEYYELSSDDGRPTGGERPAALLEPLPQEKMSGTTALRTRSSRVSMFLCRRWGTAAEHRPVLCCAVAGSCRAGYRSAEDLTGQDSAALGGSSASAADGGTVGGCADCRVLFFAPAAYCRADRRHSSFGSCWRRGGVEVFKVFLDRVQRRLLEQIVLTFSSAQWRSSRLSSRTRFNSLFISLWYCR